jgi:hypothetical protein
LLQGQNLDKMSVLPFFENERREIRKVVDYAIQNVYQLDDVLDMMNDQMDVPGTDPGHLVRISMGLWICYFLVDHPNKVRCHYFQIRPDIFGRLPDKPELEYIVKEFGIESPLLDEHVTVDKLNEVTKIVLPV